MTELDTRVLLRDWLGVRDWKPASQTANGRPFGRSLSSLAKRYRPARAHRRQVTRTTSPAGYSRSNTAPSPTSRGLPSFTPQALAAGNAALVPALMAIASASGMAA
jgi:hypothetical protein